MKRSIHILVYSCSFLFSMQIDATCTSKFSNVDITKPDNIYVDHGNGTITDKETGLMWQKCQLGNTGTTCSSGSAITLTWQAALEAAKNNSDYGYSDWRLPNIKELESLQDITCRTIAINNTVFPATEPGVFWSSTPAQNSTNAWVINFSGGGVYVYYGKSQSLNVRLVRGSY